MGERTEMSPHALGMSEECVFHTVYPNADGSLTCEGQVCMYGPARERWGRWDVKVRLPADGPEAKAMARRLFKEGRDHG